MENRGEKEMKIEPMSVEEIKALIIDLAPLAEWPKVSRLILAWIHAEARARMLEYIGRHSDCDDECFFGEDHIEVDGRGELPHFIAAVKREVGWQED